MDIVLLVAIITLTFVGFTLERLPIDAVALTCLALLLVFDLITAEEAIAGFSNPAVITVMMMFILSHGLTHTGLIDKFGNWIAQLAGTSHMKASVSLLLTCGVLSAFINNTAALAIFMPVGIQIAKHYRMSASKLLLPLSYVSIIGGTGTLIGTSTNLLVASLAEEAGMQPFGVFEFIGLGSILFGLGAVYVLIVPMKRLPDRSSAEDLTGKYHLSDFLTELRIPSGSNLVGATVLREQVAERFQINVLEILRGEQRIAIDLRRTSLAEDDLLIVRGEMTNIIRFKDQYGLLLLTDVKLRDSDLADGDNILAEIQVSPLARIAGQTLKEIDFRKNYGCFVLALQRTGETIQQKLATIPIRQWDTLLVFGPRPRVEALYSRDDFLPLQELNLRLRLPRRWWISVAILPLVVLLAATGLMSILKAAILGVVAMIVTRSLSVQQAYGSINWTVIFLLAAILPLGTAMQKTGLADLIGQAIADAGSGYGPFIALSIIYLATAFLSEIVSNNSTAVLMLPIAMRTAESLELNTMSFVMAVAFAASASFLTPMGYQTNAMVYGPGGYRFTDYIVAGLPLKLAFWLVTTLLIPWFWPLGG